MAPPISRVALCALPLFTACNVIVGLSKLEEVDCVTNCATGAGGVADGGASLPAGVWLGRGHSCATMTDETLRCWGANGNGQLGDGTNKPHLTPAPVASLTGVT